MCLEEVKMIEKAQSSRSLTECLLHGPWVFSCIQGQTGSSFITWVLNRLVQVSNR